MCSLSGCCVFFLQQREASKDRIHERSVDKVLYLMKYVCEFQLAVEQLVTRVGDMEELMLEFVVKDDASWVKVDHAQGNNHRKS
mmetsp:Transcript_31373/g.52375  ORF Transcript_31373/g.52375 Transcript_31373/m.52375 type:complete len:84 (+) Transcript_31373:82-333(+)